jgi:hypothetical protein
MPLTSTGQRLMIGLALAMVALLAPVPVQAQAPAKETGSRGKA